MNLLEELRAEHDTVLDMLFQVEQLADEIERGLLSEDSKTTASREAGRLVERLISQMTSHEERERRFLFPAIRRWLPQAVEALEDVEREHGHLKAALSDAGSRLGTLAVCPAPEFLAFVRRFIAALREHIFHEEKGIYPLTENGLSPQELEGLAQEAEASEAPELVDTGGGGS